MKHKFYSNSSIKHLGFTIVELLIVVVVIAVIAAITVVAYTNIQQRAVASVMKSDLGQAAKTFELYKVNNGNYPTSMPSEARASNGYVLSATQTTSDRFCINAYYTSNPSLAASWDSQSGLNDTHCSGAAIGQT
ncbi:MAG: prepilin-type N-terminal cleavage/methylation domain-containing protein, partial [bacterium]|nr:prepilin-type N-terminal cleavage/methylation domain-containing protein [bacterium]